MNSKKIVITGGPSTGKSSIINELKRRNYTCFDEISRQVTLEAQKEGIQQLFLTDPMLFSKRLIEGRKAQYDEANTINSQFIFLDRGVHDVIAYMDFATEPYPSIFVDICKACRYDYIFVLKPWQSIYVGDNERYENFEQAVAIHDHLINTYSSYNYNLLDVPFDSIEKRTDYIINTINNT